MVLLSVHVRVKPAIKYDGSELFRRSRARLVTQPTKIAWKLANFAAAKHPERKEEEGINGRNL